MSNHVTNPSDNRWGIRVTDLGKLKRRLDFRLA